MNGATVTHLSVLKGVNTGLIKPLKWKLTVFMFWIYLTCKTILLHFTAESN